MRKCKEAFMVIPSRRSSKMLRRAILVAAVVMSSFTLTSRVVAQQPTGVQDEATRSVRSVRRLPPVESEAAETGPQTVPAPAAFGQPAESGAGIRLPIVRHNHMLQTAPTQLSPPLPISGPAATRQSPNWLRSITTDSCSGRALAQLEEASRAYSVGAWASAEASGWEALAQIARGIDIADRQTRGVSLNHTSASGDLQAATTALREARDFMAFSSSMDPKRIATVAASHQTPIFAAGVPQGIRDIEAVDRYLDFARLKLSGLAEASVHAARALDLIAAVRLGRDSEDQLPMETSLCLRRAAFQGQPSNGSLASRLGMQLAEMGLDREAERTLRHASQIEPSREVSTTLASVMMRRGHRDEATQLIAQMRREMPAQAPTAQTPEVIELTPAQFAAISPAHNLSPSMPTAPPALPAPTHAAEGEPIVNRGHVEVAQQSPRQQVTARPVGFRSQTYHPTPSDSVIGASSAQASGYGRSSVNDEPSKSPSPLGRILGKLPKFPKFRIW